MGKVINSESELITKADAEKLSGISQVQVSRWRNSLHNKEHYRGRMLVAAYRGADLAAAVNHRAEGTGENDWHTPYPKSLTSGQIARHLGRICKLTLLIQRTNVGNSPFALLRAKPGDP